MESMLALDSMLAAAVALLYLVTAGWTASVGVSALRTRSFAPELGLDVHGRAASLAGAVALVLAAAFLAAGMLVTYVAAQS